LNAIEIEATIGELKRLCGRRKKIASEFGALVRRLRSDPAAVTVKEWSHREAERLGITPIAAFCRLNDGKYPGLKRISVNSRLTFVLPAGEK
jgi:hypothetical protein